MQQHFKLARIARICCSVHWGGGGGGAAQPFTHMLGMITQPPALLLCALGGGGGCLTFYTYAWNTATAHYTARSTAHGTADSAACGGMRYDHHLMAVMRVIRGTFFLIVHFSIRMSQCYTAQLPVSSSSIGSSRSLASKRRPCVSFIAHP